jgi:Helix-turn-helix domain
MSEVWKTKLPITEKMVLLVIADHASDDGTEAWPSQATIAKKASISIRTVQRCVNSLQSQGFLRMEKHAGGSKNCREDRRPHRYTINLTMLRDGAVTPRQADTNGATPATDTGRLPRPKNHTIEPSIETPFDLFWSIYPRKTAKIEAKTAFAKAIEKASAEEILQGAQRFADDPYRHPTFTPHPATWLNQGRWADDPLPPRELTHEEKKAIEAKALEARRKRDEEERLRWQAEIAERERNATKGVPESVKKMLEELRR